VAALVEETLFAQFDAKIGDEIRLGTLKTRIGRSVEKVPGETVAFASIAPRVLRRDVRTASLGLLREGSLAVTAFPSNSARGRCGQTREGVQAASRQKPAQSQHR